MTTCNSGSIFRVRYPLPCASHYSRWEANAPANSPMAVVRRRALQMLDEGFNCVQIARELSAHPQTIRKWKRHRDAYGDEVSVTGLKRGPKALGRRAA